MSRTKRLNLALQGGGSQGAFSWGVLDALIEDGRLEIEALSGTSAGVMAGAMFLQGWAKNGPQSGRDLRQGGRRDHHRHQRPLPVRRPR